MTTVNQTNKAISTNNFLNSIGSDTHIAYTDGGYANVQNIISDLKYLGFNQIRDGISNGVNGAAPLASYIAIAQAGIKFTFIIEGSDNASLETQLGWIDQVEAAVPGSVVGIEGPNEINNQPVTYNGVGGLQGALNMQKDIYKDVHSDPNLVGVPVDYFTGYPPGSPDPMTTPGLADNDTQHPYPNWGQAPAFWVSRAQALPNTTAATARAVYTETGYTTNQVDAAVQAKYTLDLLMDTAKENILKTYLYDLMDAYAPGSPQGDDGYGLFDYTKTPKPAAVALHNLTTLLQDTGAKASTFQPSTLNYSLSGLPSTGNSLVLEKSDGTFMLVVWAEPQIWNNNTNTEIAAPSQNVTVTLPQSYKSIQVYDPLSGTNAIAGYANQNNVTVSVSDHPILIALSNVSSVTPPPVNPNPAPSDILVLSLSEDAYAGNAQFTISVDGHQFGGTRSVTALHGSGQSEDFILAGNFGAGAHNVAVNFLNDAYGGTASTDRNLYVDAITLDGVTTAENAAQLSQGTANYTVTKPTTTQNVLVLNLSEDPNSGNAEVTVSVDGKAVGGVQTLTAQHALGQSQDVTLTGAFGAGPHVIAINVVNDANGGSSATNRNVYVNAITLDGAETVEDKVQAVTGAVQYTIQPPATIVGTSGNDKLVGTSTNNLMIGESGYDAYVMRSTDQSDTIINGTTGTAQPMGVLETAASHNQLWFERSGNDLLADVIGTHQQAIMKDWYNGSGGQQLQQIVGGDDIKIDTGLQSLVQAMASFATANAFDPTATTHTTLTDPYFSGTLASAVSSLWHK